MFRFHDQGFTLDVNPWLIRCFMDCCDVNVHTSVNVDSQSALDIPDIFF